LKTLWRILIGSALALALAAGAIAISLYVDAARPEHPVGFQYVSVPNPKGKPVSIAIWYPTVSTPGFKMVGHIPQMLAVDGSVAGENLPLIVISHGGGEPLAGRADNALALASAGFVAAAVIHADDEALDTRYAAMPRWLTDRQREIHLALGYMLRDWPAHRQLNSARVGMLGFSNGGFTTLVAIGGVPNPAQIASRWKQPRLSAPDVPAGVWVHEPTVKAAVLAAPALGRLFAPSGLSQVRVPVQLWSGTIDRIVPYEKSAAVIRRLLPQPAEFHLISGAGHLTFISPCPTLIRFLWFCTEERGFDRAAFHRAFNHSVIDFYRRKL
jgi:predicted dienelactone hydrolase